MEIQEFVILILVELIGAFAGVYLGYSQAVKQERKIRKDEEREERGNIAKSLLAEVAINKNYLDKGMELRPLSEGGPEIHWFWYKLTSNSFDSAISSGKFSKLSGQTQIHLSLHYEGIKKMNSKTQILEYSIPLVGDGYRPVDQEAILKGLTEGLPDVIKSLESEIGAEKSI